MANQDNGIVLYHYSFSPFARRILWYLALRGIAYAECKQPPVMPRPDLKALGVQYRRIPVMSIGKDIYCDTRIILRKLEQRFPDGALGASDPDQQAMERLLETWMIEAGVFMRGSQLIPADMPLLKDPKFQKDREDFSGRSWSTENINRGRPEALASIRNGFNFLETTLLADGRDWVLKTQKPTLADIEAIWVFDWVNGLKGAIPKDLISEKQYPKVFAWIARFNKEVNAAKAKGPKPTTLKGDAATQRILNAEFSDSGIGIDASDPLNLQQGEEVEVWPLDSGFRARDNGKLVGLNSEEVVIQIAETGVRLHYPRTGFRIASRKASSKL